MRRNFTSSSTSRVVLFRVLAGILFCSAALVSSSASADRYWDVPEAAAASIAKRVTGKVVVEYCPGCDDGIVAVSRVVSAQVAPEGGAGEKQVMLVRGASLVGTLSDAGVFNGTCVRGGAAQDDALDKAGFKPTRLDIPYAYVLTGDAFVWVARGEKVLSENAAVLSLTDEVREKISACTGAKATKIWKAQEASDFLFSTAGEFKKQNHSLDIDGDGKKEAVTWSLAEGNLVRDVLPPRKKNIRVRYFELRMKKSKQLLMRQPVPGDIEAQKPESDLSEVRAGVVFTAKKTGKSPGGFGVLISSPKVDDFAFVAVTTTKGKRKARLHWLGRWNRSWGGTFSAGPTLMGSMPGNIEVSTTFTPQMGRFSSKMLRFATGDELNVREKSGMNPKVGRMDLGDVAFSDSALESHYGWTPVHLTDGTSGFISSRFVDSVASVFDISAGATDGRGVRRRLTEEEARFIGFSAKHLANLRSFGRDVRKATTPKKVCAQLKAAEKLSESLREKTYGLFDRNDYTPVNEVLHRVETEAPGLDFVIFSEGSIILLRPTRIGARLPRKAPERSILRAYEAMRTKLHPIWIDHHHDFGGCSMPKRATVSLKLLRKWNKVDACIRDTIQEQMVGAVKNLTTSNCYCESRAKAIKSVDKTAKVLEKLPAVFKPAELAKNWREATAKAPADKFGSDCAP